MKGKLTVVWQNSGTGALGPVGSFPNSPTDPDGDDEFEDVNGDETANIADGQALFVNRNDAEVLNNPDAFEFNDDSFSIGDIQAYFVAVIG